MEKSKAAGIGFFEKYLTLWVILCMIVTTTEIKPNEEIAFSGVLDAETYAAMKDKIACIKAYIVGTSSDFTINPDGYWVTLPA